MQTSPPEDKLKDPGRKWCCAVERHPIKNMRRRSILSAVKEMREELPDYKFYGNIQDGNVYMNNIPILKPDSVANVTKTGVWFEHPALQPLVWPFRKK